MWRNRRVFQQLRNINPSWKDWTPWIHAAAIYSDAPRKKGKLAPLQERKMVDRFRLWVKGGKGGDGCTSYQRSRHARHAAPDGGSGGKGGNVILESSAAVWDLSNLQHHLNAKKGGHGFSKNKVGSRGADKVVQVPVGTVVHLVSGTIPSTVQATPDQERFPWEIPTTNLGIAENADLGFQSNRASTCAEASEVSTNTEAYEVARNGKGHKVDTKKKRNAVYLSSPNTLEQNQNTNQLDTEASENESWMEMDESYFDYEASENENGSDDLESECEEEMIQYSVAEFIDPGQRLLVACGGDGGRGNVAMGKDSRSPKAISRDEHDSGDGLENIDMETGYGSQMGLSRPEHEPGQPGSEAVLILELKTIADIGLVGAPNAGKSTLLGAISRAKPSVGHYAFTTLRPNIGKLEYEDFFCVTVADIPGLIKGAHENRGLGHAFLRHIERTKALAYVVDLSAALGDRKGPHPWHQLRDLVFELEKHQPGLSSRSALIVANKIDENGAEQVFEELKRRIPSVPIFPVCAVLEEGIPELKAGLRELIEGPQTWKLEITGICVD
eukprot:Gb_39094 [translate_table: standard]